MARPMTLLIIVGVLFAVVSISHSKHPVVILPGLGGSRLWYKRTLEDMFKLAWIYPFHFPKLLQTLTLHFDESTNKTDDGPDRTNSVCNFGDADALKSLVVTWLPRQPKLTEAQCHGTQFPKENFDLEPSTSHSRDVTGACSNRKFEFTKFYNDDELQIKWSKKKKRKQLKLLDAVKLYKKLVDTLEENGYTSNKDLLGVPYDFRKAPPELDTHYEKLRRLIEDAYTKNGNSPVVVVAHSYGNRVMLHFYNKLTTKAWRDRYIHAHIALGAPWAGAVKATKTVVSGDCPVESLSPLFPKWLRLKMRAAFRTWPSLLGMMPCVECGVWDNMPPVIVTPTRSYSAKDVNLLFEDINNYQGTRMWSTVPQVDLSKLPDLRQLHVMYGTEVDTPYQMVFTSGFPDTEPQVKTNKDGDGTVNLISMEVFKRFTPPPHMNVTHKALPGVDHVKILQDKRVLDLILDVAKGP